MKIRLTFKTPDVTDQLEPEELEAAKKWLEQYVEYGEYICVEVDTDTNESKIIPV